RRRCVACLYRVRSARRRPRRAFPAAHEAGKRCGGSHRGRSDADGRAFLVDDSSSEVLGLLMRSLLVLEDGTVFEGEAIGAAGTAVGEVVFSTSMTGYQEMLSDPSYAGQLLTLTYPLIGNYGVTDLDLESRGVQVSGFIVKQLCRVPSNWRSGEDL